MPWFLRTPWRILLILLFLGTFSWIDCPSNEFLSEGWPSQSMPFWLQLPLVMIWRIDTPVAVLLAFLAARWQLLPALRQDRTSHIYKAWYLGMFLGIACISLLGCHLILQLKGLYIPNSLREVAGWNIFRRNYPHWQDFLDSTSALGNGVIIATCNSFLLAIITPAIAGYFAVCSSPRNWILRAFAAWFATTCILIFAYGLFLLGTIPIADSPSYLLPFLAGYFFSLFILIPTAFFFARKTIRLLNPCSA
jgi:hypothetical protein